MDREDHRPWRGRSVEKVSVGSLGPLKLRFSAPKAGRQRRESGHGWKSVSCDCHNKVPQAERLKQQKCIVSHSGGWKSEMQVSIGHIPSEGTREGSVPGISPSFRQFLGSWQHNSSFHMAFSLCECLCPNFCLFKGHQSYWLQWLV